MIVGSIFASDYMSGFIEENITVSSPTDKSKITNTSIMGFYCLDKNHSSDLICIFSKAIKGYSQVPALILLDRYVLKKKNKGE
jgi:hypothetical protein